MIAYPVDYQLDVLQVRAFGVQTGLVMPKPSALGGGRTYPDKIRVNLYYLSHYSFFKDLEMIVCTVLGRKMMYGGEWI